MLSDRAPQTLADPALMDSAVLLLLYPKDGEYCVLFNKRTDEVEFNKGDICFPGGAKDAEDADFAFTARREAHEEMGIHPEDVTILGELNEASTRAGFRIHPFVGTIPYPYQFEPSSAEVAAVLEVPLSTLLDPANIIDGERHRPDGTSEPTRSYAYEDHLIVGATARIVRQFLDLLEQSGWTKEE
jgi:8-oxo-dGTP pyrophosphatase MutT (NUDIX family)